MKKLFSLVTVMLCVAMLSTTVFAATTDPLAVYGEYLQNSANIKSMGLTISQKLSMVDGTDSVDVLKQDISAKLLMPSKNKLQMEMKTVDPTSGEVWTSYFKDDYLYQQVGKEKYKLKMNMDQALASAANVDIKLTEDMLKDAKLEIVDEGVKITYKTNLNDVKDEQGNSIASLLANAEWPDGMKVSISSMTSSATIGFDGVLKSGSNLIKMKISDDETTLEFKITQTFKVNSVNSISFINFPEDLDSYQTLAV